MCRGHVGRDGSSVGSALNAHAGNPDSSPDENVLLVQTLPAFHPVVDILGNQRSVDLIPCGMGCKRTFVIEIEDRVSVCLTIIIRPITRHYIGLPLIELKKT